MGLPPWPRLGYWALPIGLVMSSCDARTPGSSPDQPNPATSPVAAASPVAGATCTTPAALASAFLYVAHGRGQNDLGRISGYAIDPATGRLSPVPGSPYTRPQPTNAMAIAVDPCNRFVYASTEEGDAWGFRIAGDTGALTPVNGSPFHVGADTESLTFDAFGHFLYVADLAAEVIRSFRVDPESGVLTPTEPRSFPALNNVSTLAVEPSGRFLLGTGLDSSVGSVLAYAIDPSTGALARRQTIPLGNVILDDLVVHATGRWLYVAGRRGSVFGFSVDASSGALRPVPGSPFPTGSVDRFALAPSGGYAYALSSSFNRLAGFTVDVGSGDVQPLGAELSTDRDPRAMTLDPSGRFAYVASYASGTISVFGIDRGTGRLAVDRVLPIVAPPRPRALATTHTPPAA
jgi:6-phosphogluconolactonase (cycloisomerase 2 family)